MMKTLLASVFVVMRISSLSATDASLVDPEQDPKPHSTVPSLISDFTPELLSLILLHTGEYIETFKEFGKVSKAFNVSMKHALTTYPHIIYTNSSALTIDNVEIFRTVPKIALAVLNPNEKTIMLIGKLINLTYLDLSRTVMTDKHCPLLSGLTNLSMLTLSETNTGPGLTCLTTLSALQYLDLDYTHITDTELACLATLEQLSQLYLEGTPVTNEGLFSLGGLTNLRYLNIDETVTTEQGLVHIKTLTNLTGLSLFKTNIRDEGLLHLTNLTKLERLILRSTKVTNAGLPYLRPLNRLKFIDVANTDATEEGRAQLSTFQKISE